MGSHRVGHDWSDLAAAAAAYVPLCKIEMSFQMKEDAAVHENDISKKCCKNICASRRPNLVLLNAAKQCSVKWRN